MCKYAMMHNESRPPLANPPRPFPLSPFLSPQPPLLSPTRHDSVHQQGNDADVDVLTWTVANLML